MTNAEAIANLKLDKVDRPEWDDYWMCMAEVAKTRSTDDDCRVGAVIVKQNVLLSTGYNGLARGVQHYEYRTTKEKHPEEPEKLRWMCHAEQNAIYNAARMGVSVEGAKIYTTKFPCLICTNAIVQAGITTIYTTDVKTYKDNLVGDDGRRVFHVLAETNVRLEPPNLETELEVMLAAESKGRSGRNGARRPNGRKPAAK